MSKAETYRAKAEECLREAEGAPPHLQDELRSLAERWRRLADHVDQGARPQAGDKPPNMQGVAENEI